MLGEQNKLILGDGYDIENLKKITKVELPDEYRKGHFWCFGTTRSGKALFVNALVHTPRGWKRIGDMKAGDKVTTPDDGTATVTGVFPQGKLDLYNITFEDGRSVEASGDHLWEIWIDENPYLFTTNQIKEKIKTENLYIRLIKPNFKLLEGFMQNSNFRVLPNKNIEFHLLNENRAEFARRLVWGLGFMAKQYGKNLLVDTSRRRIRVESITYSRKAEAVCIKIDSEDGLFITDNYIVTHNTRLMESMIAQDIRKGYSIVVIDPKGDSELLSNIVLTAAETNRLKDLIYVSPIYPNYSAIIDPLSHYYMPEELVSHIISGVETGKEPFFYNVAYEISLAVVLSLIEKQKYIKQNGFNLLDIKNTISHTDLEVLTEQVKLLSYSNKELEQLYRDLKKILESPQDYYSKISSSLRVALTELTSGNIGRIIGKADSNRFITRLEKQEGVILIAQLGSLLTGRAAYTVGKVLLSMIASFVGRIFASGRTISPQLAIYIDEAQNVMYHNIDDMFAKAGGAGVWVHGFCQSISQLNAELGEEKAKTILDNTNTKVFMRVPDVETSEYASRFFGQKRVVSPILSSTGSISSREEEMSVVEYDELLNLKPRYFYVISYHGKFKGKTLNTKKVILPLPHNAKFQIVFPKIETTVKKGAVGEKNT